MDPTAPQSLGDLSTMLSGILDPVKAGLSSQDLSSAFQDVLSAVNSQKPPSPQPVPAGLNPIGSIASAFASTLAGQLGATQAPAEHMARETRSLDEIKSTEAENRKALLDFQATQQKNRYDILLHIGEAKAEQLKQMGSIDLYAAQVKTNAALADRSAKMQEQIDMRKLAQEHINKMAEITATKTLTGDQKKEAADAKASAEEDKLVNLFGNQVQTILTNPASIDKSQKTGGIGSWHIFGQTTGALTPTATGLLLGRASATVRSAKSPRLKDMAMETYFETATQAGRMTRGTPDWNRFVDLLKIYTGGDHVAALQWMTDHGITP